VYLYWLLDYGTYDGYRQESNDYHYLLAIGTSYVLSTVERLSVWTAYDCLETVSNTLVVLGMGFLSKMTDQTSDEQLQVQTWRSVNSDSLIPFSTYRTVTS
jgi:hypothetical protein